MLLPPRPANDAGLPTPIPQENSISLEELLGSPVQTPTLAEQTPEPVATLPPTEVATVTPIPTPTAPNPYRHEPPRVTESSALSGVQLVSSAPSKARNHGFTYTKQTWNNCGPANVTMSLRLLRLVGGSKLRSKLPTGKPRRQKRFTPRD
ncbi:MAG UNVERIFIED_CONTAM: hypothetical protein LVT10_15495 [Anaerolineae bacterium]